MLNNFKERARNFLQSYYDFLYLNKPLPKKEKTKRYPDKDENYHCGNCKYCVGDEKHGYFCKKISKWIGSWWIGYYEDLSKNRCENWEKKDTETSKKSD